ncbi:2036_t:CDS:2, partial [Acaulospora colombiana]
RVAGAGCTDCVDSNEAASGSAIVAFFLPVEDKPGDVGSKWWSSRCRSGHHLLPRANMPAYHSSFNEEADVRIVGNVSLLPFKSKIRGPAPIAEAGSVDIIDETLDLFRANSLFRNFEIKGPADRLLIILILFVSDCLAKITASRTPPTQIEATKTLNTLAVDNFPIPVSFIVRLSHNSLAVSLQIHYVNIWCRLDKRQQHAS